MNRIYVIAEMAWSHDGRVDRAKAIIDAAAAAGADAMSIHFTNMPTFMSRYYGTGRGRVSAGKETRPIYDYLSDISLSFEQWREVVAHARAWKLDLVALPNDRGCFEFVKSLKPEAYVLSASIFDEIKFIEEIAAEGKPVYLRVGGSSLGDIEAVMHTIRRAGNDRITLLYGHQNYPTKISDTRLNFLRVLQDAFGVPVGMADHIDADDDFALVAPLLGIPLGITCIEKHVTYDRSAKGEDFESALNASELKLLVERVRKTEEALGPRHMLGLDDSSAAYRDVMRKRLVAARDIKAGETLKEDMVIAKRSDEGANPGLLPLFLGRRVRQDLGQDRGITMDLFSES